MIRFAATLAVLALTGAGHAAAPADTAKDYPNPHLNGPICKPLRDITYVRSFRVDPDIDTVVWEHGADFAPEFLYEIGQDVSEQLPADGPSLRFGR